MDQHLNILINKLFKTTMLLQWFIEFSQIKNRGFRSIENSHNINILWRRIFLFLNDNMENDMQYQLLHDI